MINVLLRNNLTARFLDSEPKSLRDFTPCMNDRSGGKIEMVTAKIRLVTGETETYEDCIIDKKNRIVITQKIGKLHQLGENGFIPFEAIVSVEYVEK